MTFRAFLSQPSVAALRCLVVGVLMAALMLWVNWEVVPGITRKIFGATALEPAVGPLRSISLAFDVVVCFVTAVLLMRAAQALGGQFGVVAAAVMAFAGWWQYFREVGYFTGMLGSEFSLWYEVPSFAKYWVAYFVSQLLWRGPNYALNRAAG